MMNNINLIIMNKSHVFFASLLLFCFTGFGQSEQPNILSISLLGKSDRYQNNNTGIGINFERFVSRNRLLSVGLSGEYYAPSRYMSSYYRSADPSTFDFYTNQTYKIGARAALHWQVKKFDFYAGLQLSYRRDYENHVNSDPMKLPPNFPTGFGNVIGPNYRIDKQS